MSKGLASERRQYLCNIFSNYLRPYLAIDERTGPCLFIAHINLTAEISRWRHQMETFSALLAICAGNSPGTGGIHQSPVNSLHKGQWRGALMFSLICVWINGWVSNREAGDLRRYCAHYDVTVMMKQKPSYPSNTIWLHRINITSSICLLPDGTKPLPEQMLTYHQWGIVAFTWGPFHKYLLKIYIPENSLKFTNLILQ